MEHRSAIHARPVHHIGRAQLRLHVRAPSVAVHCVYATLDGDHVAFRELPSRT